MRQGITTQVCRSFHYREDGWQKRGELAATGLVVDSPGVPRVVAATRHSRSGASCTGTKGTTALTRDEYEIEGILGHRLARVGNKVQREFLVQELDGVTSWIP